jgi:cytochrome c-type biogenesis protein CcmH/NrfG
VEAVKRAKRADKRCAVLIGAGCSVSAGIPLANGFVEEIHKKYPKDYKRAKEKAYAACMAELPPALRRELIRPHLEKAKINWAHVAIAQLMAHGYVDRVLTTNFDQLLIKACALIDQYPGTYDLAASHLFKPHYIPERAIYYLHGQFPGFVQLHTETECQKHFKALGPVFDEVGAGRPWIVVGYSGINDPVFRRLVKLRRFDKCLFWVGYKDQEPSPELRKHLLDRHDETYAHYVKDFDADDFLVQLAQELKCFPPDFVRKPFSFLKARLSHMAPYKSPGSDAEEDVLKETRAKIDRAIKTQDSPRARVLQLMMAGHYQGVLNYAAKAPPEELDEIREYVAWAHVMLGNAAHDAGRYGEACENYSRAIGLKPDMQDAFYNWANSLLAWAKTKHGDEADRLFEEAGAKYAQAVNIKPEMEDAWNNWGQTLSGRANTKQGSDADRLFGEAVAKYEHAVRIKPDMYAAWSNWGAALTKLAKTKQGADADRHFEEAGAKNEQAVRIKPDFHEAWNNWGTALAEWAKTKQGAEADRLFKEAGEKYEQAVRIRPDFHEAWSNWGTTLTEWAKTKLGAEADCLFEEAVPKFEQAIKIMPDKHEAFFNWGTALSEWAETKQGADADRLLEQAGAKYAQAVKIKPDKYEAWNNWGNALGGLAKTKRGAEADRLFEQAGAKYEQAVKIKPDMHEASNNWGAAQLYWARTKQGAEADRLLEKARAACLRAEEIKFGSGAYNLACIAAIKGEEEECRKWLEVSRFAGVLPARKHLEKDSDLDLMRDKPWFKDFLAALKE